MRGVDIQNARNVRALLGRAQRNLSVGIADLDSFRDGNVAACQVRRIHHELSHITGDRHESDCPGMRLLPTVGSVEARYIDL